MEKLLYNIGNKTVEFTSSAPFLLVSVEGADGVSAEVQTTKSPYQDGTTYHDSVIGERQISINGAIWAETEDDLFSKRRELLALFNPKAGAGTLTYTNNVVTKVISAYVAQPPVFKAKVGLMIEFLIVLKCPNPFWLDNYTSSKEIALWVGGLEFPLTLPTSFSTKGALEVIVRNNGDVEAPVTIEFAGPATNPIITNVTTGEFIKVNRIITADEKLIISTEFGKKRVEVLNELTGETVNVFNWVDLQSTFWQLQQGTNIINCDSDAGTNDAKTLIKWKNRFLGV